MWRAGALLRELQTCKSLSPIRLARRETRPRLSASDSALWRVKPRPTNPSGPVPLRLGLCKH